MDARAGVTGCAGMPGCGKTYYLQLVCGAAVALERRAVVLDLDGTFPGAVFTSVAQYEEEAARLGPPYLSVFRPQSREDEATMLDYCAALVATRGGTLLVDDAPQVLRRLSRDLWRVTRRGRRHPPASLVWASHRFVDVCPDVQVVTSTLVLFHTTHGADLDWYAGNCGAWGEQLAARLPGLAVGDPDRGGGWYSEYYVVPRDRPLPPLLPPPFRLDLRARLWRLRARG